MMSARKTNLFTATATAERRVEIEKNNYEDRVGQSERFHPKDAFSFLDTTLMDTCSSNSLQNLNALQAEIHSINRN